MSERERVSQIISRLPDNKIGYVLAYLQGFIDAWEAEDDAFCEKLYQDYMNDSDPHKNDTISLEDLAAELGVKL